MILRKTPPVTSPLVRKELYSHLDALRVPCPSHSCPLAPESASILTFMANTSMLE